MPILECHALEKRYGSAMALDHIDLALEPGRIIGLLGPNGSGKSTLSPWMKTRQLLDFYCDFYADFDRQAAERMLTHLGLNLNQSIRQMSKGMKEKVQLVLTMSRKAKLYLLDEPIGGVDPATRDYILHTIISNYNPEAAVVISTHLIADVEPVLDEVIFLNQGKISLHESCDEIRETRGQSVDALFREVFKCWEN